MGMASKDFSELRERVGAPNTASSVEVKLHDAVYNFGRAKYPGLDAHLGAICVVNGWLDKVKVHVDEKTGKRTYKLPYIHPGQKVKMAEASKAKELDKIAIEYWHKKYPIKAKPTAPKSPDNPKDSKESVPTPSPAKDKRVSEIEAAKKAAQDLQTDLMGRNAQLDKGIGSVFGHGADALENLYGHGSDKVRKSLNEKQNQIKAMGKYANEGKLDEFGSVHKSLTGVDFDPSKKTAKLNVEQDFQEFKKHHTAGVENLTELATVGANWGLMAYLGKAKGMADLAKQALMMTGFGGAVKAGLKGIEHGNLSTGAEDFRTGAISGFGFFAADKITHHVASKFQGQSFGRAIYRGAASGAAGGGIYGAIEAPNMGYAHANNEGRNYDVGHALSDGAYGLAGGTVTGGTLGALFGAAGHGWRTWRAGQTPPMKNIGASAKPGALPGGSSSPTSGFGRPGAASAEGGLGTGKTSPQAEAPPPQGETPPPQAEAVSPPPEAVSPPQAEAWDIALKPWQNFEVPQGATWQQLREAFNSFRRHCTGDAIQGKLKLGVGTPEYEAWVSSKSYTAVSEFNKKVNAAWESIRNEGMPANMKARNTKAPDDALKIWNQLESEYAKLQEALESYKAGI